MKHSYPTSEPLKFLLQMIHNREMALPDFQRDFVWDPAATDELIESIISNYPAGSLLRIKNGFQLIFQPREIQGAPALGIGAKPSYLILDGQQRLTSLYQGFYGVGEHKYFANVSELEKNRELEDCIFYLRTEEADAKYGTIDQQASTLVFPLGKIFGDTGFSGWVTQVLKLRCKDMEAVLDLQARLTRVYEQWIRPIEQYEFPMVTLNEETPAPAVCTIFETLNRTGIKLSVFELLTARFWAQDLNLRKQWEEAKSEYSLMEDYDIDPYYVLQIVALLEPGVDQEGRPKAPSIKRSATLEMKVDDARKGWNSAIEGLAEILDILRSECGVLTAGLIPYNTMLMAAVWASQNHVKGAAVGANKIKLLRWFWCSVFGQKYENAPNSQAEKDFGELKQWMSVGNPPESVVNFRADELDLSSVRPKQRAVYRGTMALILQNGAMDFHNRGKITSQLIADKKNPLDDHHIFPQAFLNERNISPSLRDCILNRTYIDRITNIRLSRRAPSDYFAELRAKHGIHETDTLLASHVLPPGDNSPLLSDDFAAFLEARHKALLELVLSRAGGVERPKPADSYKIILKETISEGEVERPEKVEARSEPLDDDDEGWNGRDFYVSLGDGTRRSWEDCRKYGFVSGGGGKWYSQTLKRLFPGARVFVNIPKIGYVGVGIVQAEAVPVMNFTVVVNDERKRILELPLSAPDMGKNMDNAELSEYVVAVTWIKSVPKADGYWEKGLFALQHTACRLKDDFTIERLTQHFDLDV